MGFCAQFGSYSLMDLQSNKLIDVQPIAVSKKIIQIFGHL